MKNGGSCGRTEESPLWVDETRWFERGGGVCSTGFHCGDLIDGGLGVHVIYKRRIYV